ncbi:hypothetical protein Q673_06240 [Marinobacter sp. EN3]|uniref:hypothetical protein n=1 Tax=Marinobacter sp. EN3 TaxID=1397533 RepID=UPI0003B8D577|nr:hypothetical protein [Marinobacter sp. EN3]ERS04812.1 hypothetical protein Q673_06240 [Marinobacter sp. EN3]
MKILGVFFLVLAFIAFFAAIVGLFSPRLVLRRSYVQTRTMAFGGYLLLSFLLTAVGAAIAINYSVEDETPKQGLKSEPKNPVVVSTTPADKTIPDIAEGAESLSDKPEPVEIGHFYVLKDGSKYGYQPVTSQYERDSGQATSKLVMARYFGRKDDTYQIDMIDGNFHHIVECERPCEYLKIMIFYKDDLERTDYMKSEVGTIAWSILQDAVNGHLDIHTVERNTDEGPVRHYIWADESRGPILTPVSESTRQK